MSLRKWEIIEEKNISPNKWFPLFVEKVRLPNEKLLMIFMWQG